MKTTLYTFTKSASSSVKTCATIGIGSFLLSLLLRNETLPFCCCWRAAVAMAVEYCAHKINHSYKRFSRKVNHISKKLFSNIDDTLLFVT